MIEYNEEYFHSDNPNTPGYTNYTLEEYERKPNIVGWLESNSLLTGSILVLGCAYGFLVKKLLDAGVNAYGVDISKYAISQAKKVKKNVLIGDVRDIKSFNNACKLARVEKFSVIIDEDLIECLNNRDAINLRSYEKMFGDNVVHFITDSPHLRKFYNYHSLDGWKNLCDPLREDYWISRMNFDDFSFMKAK